jgi:hypothetical protein
MTDQWTEPLRCPNCRTAGTVSLTEGDEHSPMVRGIAEGFKVVQTQYGPTFYCATCDVSANND